MLRFDCRRELTKELTKLGLYKETKDNPMVVPLCSRSKDVVEPLMKPQWWDIFFYILLRTPIATVSVDC